LREELARLDHQLEERRATDPEETQRILSASETNKHASDRWTENIWNIKKYLTKKKGMSGKDVSLLFLFCLTYSTAGGQDAGDRWKF
jgi:phage terminase small subunit